MNSVFRITSRDHGGLILMSFLADKYKSGLFVSLQEVADRMMISQGYLEEIASAFKKSKLVISRQGKSGGYRLAKSPSKITLKEILVSLEGPIELVDCLSHGCKCQVSGNCKSKKIWLKLQIMLEKSLKQIKLSEIA